MSVLLIAVGGLLLLLALHPFVTYPLSLRVLASLRPRRLATGAASGTAALCVCFYNEERVVRAKVRNMLAMRAAMPSLEILVYVDGATDRTSEILREYDGEIGLLVSPVRLGKTHGMNSLVRLSTADYLIFSDANVTFAPDAVPRLLAAFADPAVGCACGHLVYSRPTDNPTAVTGSLYWRLEERLKALESATGSVMGADGSIFALRRSLHRPPPADLIDDMYVSLLALCDGARVVRIEDALAYEEAVSRSEEEFRRKVRIGCQAFNVHRALHGRLRRLSPLNQYKYLSHKLLRWFEIYLLSVGVVCILAGLIVAGELRAAVALAIVGSATGIAVVRARRGVVGKLHEILAAFLATGLGVWRSMRGERFQTWNPSASARGPASATLSRGEA